MDFSLTDDHLALRDAVRRYCSAEFPASASRGPHDPATAARQQQGLAELGLMGLPFDAEFGGSGLGAVEAMLVAEELGRAAAPGPWLSNAVIAGPLLADAGTPAQCSAWLPAVAGGRLSLALVTPTVRPIDRHDAWAVTARREGSHWRLDGRPRLVPDAESASLLLVPAATDNGATLFALDADTPGLARQGFALLDGRRAAHLTLDAVHIGADRVVGPLGGAAALVDAALDRGEAALVADAAGALDALLAMTLGHLKTRHQFGQPLAAFQVLQHRVADMLVTLEQLRSMACVAAMAVDSGDVAQRRRLVSAARAFAAPRVRRCAAEAIQLHGAMGMTDECQVGHLAKRLITDALLYGDASFHLRRSAPPRLHPGDLP